MAIITPSTYYPSFVLFNRHLETIIPAIFRRVKGITYQRQRLITPDDDFLDLDWLEVGSERLVILSHGLEGDSNRPYIKGMAKAFSEKGWDVLAWNFRGCSGEINKQLKFYHSGATDDLELIINYVLRLQKYNCISLIGFSLGGNLTLKFLGEKAENIQSEIISAVTFSVPLDLYTSCLKISTKLNYVYSRRFLRNLQNKVQQKAVLMPERLMLAKHSIKKIMEFDDYYTAPLHGFKNARSYYEECSAINFLDKIKIPTLIVNALNDPFLSKECFPIEKIGKLRNVYFESPTRGGHCGFSSYNKEGLYWSEKRALEFINTNSEGAPC